MARLKLPDVLRPEVLQETPLVVVEKEAGRSDVVGVPLASCDLALTLRNKPSVSCPLKVEPLLWCQRGYLGWLESGIRMKTA